MKERATREAGAIRPNVFFWDMNVDVSVADGRNEEMSAQDLPCLGGVQLAVDITLRSALSSEDEAHLDAAGIDGAVLLKARVDKEKYPEFVADANWLSW